MKVRAETVVDCPLVLLRVIRTLGFPEKFVDRAKLPNVNWVQLNVGVIVGVLVLVGVFAGVGVLVSVGVNVAVGVNVTVGVSVAVEVGVSVNVGVIVGVSVGVFVGPIPLPGSSIVREVLKVSTTPWR